MAHWQWLNKCLMSSSSLPIFIAFLICASTSYCRNRTLLEMEGTQPLAPTSTWLADTGVSYPSSSFSLSQVKYNGPQVESQKCILWITGPQHFLDDGGNLESFEVSAIALDFWKSLQNYAQLFQYFRVQPLSLKQIHGGPEPGLVGATLEERGGKRWIHRHK